MSTDPVYIRLQYGDLPGKPGSSRTYLVEVAATGEILREVGLDPAGRPVYITRPGDYPIFDWPVPPGSSEFEEQFGEGEAMTAEDFERAFVSADAALD